MRGLRALWNRARCVLDAAREIEHSGGKAPCLLQFSRQDEI
jgi:hypothetical protein